MPRTTKENGKRKKKNSKKTEKVKQEKNINDNKFDFDDEIVIGLRRLDEPVVKNDKKKKKKAKKKAKTIKKNEAEEKDYLADEPEIIIKSKYMSNYEEDEPEQKKSNKKVAKKEKKSKKKEQKRKRKNKKVPKKLTKKQELAKKRRKVVLKVIKWLTLIAIVIAGVIYAMLSPIFNIQDIAVEGNSKVPSATILSLSGLSIGENIFEFRTSDVENQIKQEAYIDTVEITRKFPAQIEITVTEREATYELEYGNAYVYISNQGYILEITSEDGEMPLITGYSTSGDEICEGNRLCTEDLEKLNDVLKIMEAASSIDEDLKNLIKGIDISDENNYILDLTSEEKTVYLGDVSNLSTKMLWINEILEEEEGVEGTIILNEDLTMPYFNEKV